MKKSLFILILILAIFLAAWASSKQASRAESSGRQLLPPAINIAVLGHQDHGKTTLTAAIVKVLNLMSYADLQTYEQLNNPAEEVINSIPMSLVQVTYHTNVRRYNHIDCATHTDCIKNLIAGPVKLDGAILVVSAPDGPMPQTREHIRLAQQGRSSGDSGLFEQSGFDG